MMLDVIEMVTGHRITATSRQPNTYVSTHRDGEWHQVLQCHIFPHIYPGKKFGSKEYISVDMEAGDDMWVKTNPCTVLKRKEIKQRGWNSFKVRDRLNAMDVETKCDGVKSTKKLTIMEHCPPAMQQLQLHFPGKKQQSYSDDMKKTVARYTEIIKTAIKTGTRLDGIGPVSGKNMDWKSLMLLAESNLVLDFTHCGRHGSGNRALQVQAFYATCSDRRVKETLDAEFVALTVRENHQSKKVVKKNYPAYKGHELSAFTDIEKGTYRSRRTERWASHPNHRPSADAFPWTVVQPQPKDGTLFSRCGNMRYMTYEEQTAQLFWMGNLEAA
jgi:hypothetical protein